MRKRFKFSEIRLLYCLRSNFDDLIDGYDDVNGSLHRSVNDSIFLNWTLREFAHIDSIEFFNFVKIF